MSYGRHPYYIIQAATDDGSEGPFEFIDQGCNADDEAPWPVIKYDAMAQFIASMWWRDRAHHKIDDLHGELRALVDRGLEIRPDLTGVE